MITRRVPKYRCSLFYVRQQEQFRISSAANVFTSIRIFTNFFQSPILPIPSLLYVSFPKRNPLLFLANRKEYNEKWNYD